MSTPRVPIVASPTPTIHQACLVNDWELCMDLLEADISLADDIDSSGRSPLHICASLGSDEACAVLIKYGACMDLPEYESGYTPLHTSLYHRHLKITLLLLKAGADLGDRVAHAYMNESSSEKEDMRHADVCSKRDKYRSIRDVLSWKKNVDHEGLSPLDLLSTCLTPNLKRAKRALNCTSIVTFGKADYPLGIELPNLKSHVYKPKTIDTLSEIQESDIITVAASKFMSAALCKDGSVYTWGYGKGGRLGHGDITINTSNTSTAIPFPRHVSALKGHVVVGISVAESHVLAVTRGGAVFAWGSNKYGQLGLGGNISNTGTVYTSTNNNNTNDGNTTSKDNEEASASSSVGEGSMCSEPRQIYSLKKERIIGIAAGDNHSVAFNDNGEIWCWGSNSKGQLGLKPTGNSSSTANMVVYTPKQLHIGNKSNKSSMQPILQVSAGPYSTLLLRKISSEKEMEMNRYHTHRSRVERQPLKSMSEVYQFGYGNPLPTHVNFSNSHHSNKDFTEPPPNKYGYVTTIQPCATTHAVNIIQVSAGKYHNVALSSASLVYTWGLNADVLGHTAAPPTTGVSASISGETVARPNPSRNITSPRVVEGLLAENGGGRIKYVSAAGSNRTCAISEAGDLYTWGATSTTQQGVLGHGKGSSYAPIPQRVMGVKRAVQVACGENHTLVLLSAAMPPLPLDDIVIPANSATSSSSSSKSGKREMSGHASTSTAGDSHGVNRYNTSSDKRARSNSQFDDLESNDSDSDNDNNDGHGDNLNTSFEKGYGEGGAYLSSADDRNDDENTDGETYSSVVSLKNLCERELAKSINLRTAIPLLAIAERADASHLLNFATNFVDMNLDAILMHARQQDLECLIEGYDSVCNHYKRALSMDYTLDGNDSSINGNETPMHHYMPPVNGERIRRKSSGSFGSFNDLLTLNGRETPTKELPLEMNVGGDREESEGVGKALYDDRDVLRKGAPLPKTSTGSSDSSGLDSVNGVRKRMRALKKKLTVIEGIEGKMSVTSKRCSPPTIPCIPETTSDGGEGDMGESLSKEQLEKVSKKGLFQGELKRLALILTRLEAEEAVREKARALRSSKIVTSPSRGGGEGGKAFPGSPARDAGLATSPKALRRAMPPSFEEWGAMLAARTSSNNASSSESNSSGGKPVNVWSARMNSSPTADTSSGNKNHTRSLSSHNPDGSTVLSPSESPVNNKRKSSTSSVPSRSSNEEISRSFEVTPTKRETRESKRDGENGRERGASLVESTGGTGNHSNDNGSVVIPMRHPNAVKVHNSTTGATSHLPETLTLPSQPKSGSASGYNISSFLVLRKGSNGEETIKEAAKTPQKAPEPICPWRTPGSGGKTDREGSLGGSVGETPGGGPIRMMDIEAEETARMGAVAPPGGGKAWFVPDGQRVASVDAILRQEEEDAELLESLQLIEQMEAQEREVARMEALRAANAKGKGKSGKKSGSTSSTSNGKDGTGSRTPQAARKKKKGADGSGEKKKKCSPSSSSTNTSSNGNSNGEPCNVGSKSDAKSSNSANRSKSGRGKSSPSSASPSVTTASSTASNESLSLNADAAVFVPGRGL